MGKVLIYLIFVLLSVVLVSGANYDWFYNSCTGCSEQTLSNNQSGNNFTADYFIGNGSFLTGLPTNTSEDIIAVVDPLGYYNDSRKNDTVFEEVGGNLTIKYNWWESFINWVIGNTTWNGDLSGTGTYPDVNDDSHLHNVDNLTDVSNLNNSHLHNASNITGGTFPGDEYNFPSNVNVGDNISTSSYFLGQPLDGTIGSGIIQSGGIDSLGNLEINHTPSSLNLIYPDFVVRLATSFNVIKYCNISSNTVVTTDDQHSIFYVDGNCAVNEASVETYINTPFSPGGIADFMNAMAHSGDVETHIGSTVLNKYDIKTKKNHFKTSNLEVVNGMAITTETFSNYTQSEGEYSYVENILNSSEQNGSANATVEFVSHSGGVWYYNEQIGINLSYCDDGTNTVSCSNSALYRRYVLCTTGYSNGEDTTELHQLAPPNSEIFTSISNCLNIEGNPLSFTLPDQYTYTCVVNYVYCGRPNDNSWSGEFIDLRTTKTSSASAGFDVSQYLRKDGTVSLTGDWLVGLFNIFNILNLNVSDSVNASRYYQDGNVVLDTSSGHGGDVSGTNDTITVNDNSHLHTAENITNGTFGDGDYSFPEDVNMTDGNITDVTCVHFSNGAIWGEPACFI